MIEVDDTKPGEGNGGELADAFETPTTSPDGVWPLLVLQPDFPAGERAQYHVAELARYHDRHFIENVYRALLGRAPFDAERARELDDLRGGRASKVEIIERLLASAEWRASKRRVGIAGLPSPRLRRLSRVPVLGYLLRLGGALARLPVLIEHQRQFESYALAQQQLIADYINQTLAHVAGAVEDQTPLAAPSQDNDVIETVAMFSDVLLELSNSHADLQGQTQTLAEHTQKLTEQTQTQADQIQAALTELTAAITAQQQLSETLRREQQLAADAQQEFLIQEQRVIVETQQVVFEELRERLSELAASQQHARAEFEADALRRQSRQDAGGEATASTRENFSGQA